MGEEGTTEVKRRRHTPEQVIRKLREADRLLGEGKAIPEVARALEVSENTYHRWQRQFGGMKADDAKRLRELERENARLKKIVADQVLENEALKEVAKGRMTDESQAPAVAVACWPLSAGPVGDGAFVGGLGVFGGGALGLASLLAVQRLSSPARLARWRAGLEFDAAHLLRGGRRHRVGVVAFGGEQM